MEIFSTPYAWGGLTVILGLIGFLLGKFLTDANVIVIKAFLYKPIFAVFRSLTMFLNGLTAGWWNAVGEPYFKLFLVALLQTLIDGAVDGLDSDAVPQIIVKGKPIAMI